MTYKFSRQRSTMASIMSPTKIVQTEVHRNYAEWIAIFFNFYYRILLTPFLVKYDGNSGGLYKCAGGSRMAKVGFIACHTLIALYTTWGITISTMHDNSPSAIMNGLYKLSYLMFGGYNVVWAIFMWKHVPKIPDLLNKGNELYSALVQSDCECCNHIEYIPMKAWKYQLSRYLRWPCMIFVIIFTIISTLSFYTQGIEHNNVPEVLVNHVVNHTVASFCRMHQFWCTLMLEDLYEQPSLGACIVTGVWVFITIIAELSWQTIFFMMTVWALYFRKMLQLGLQRISNAATDVEMFKAVQVFSRITVLLDEWNDLFGNVLLVDFVNVMVYKCVGFAQVMSSQWGWIISSLMIITLIPHLVMLYFMADAHCVGCTVARIWKQKYIIQKRFDEPLPLDIFHASCIFHHDILANSVAFKGSGFFIVSFQFVGSIIGIITTYTLVTVQLISMN